MSELGTKSDLNAPLNNTTVPAIIMIKNAAAKATLDHIACPQQHLCPPLFDSEYISSS
jgi:hypothetical protein